MTNGNAFAIGPGIQQTGMQLSRYGLVVILLWIGGMKFTSDEAEAIRPFVENSPLMSWTYPIFGVQGLSNLLGVAEILTALLIASRPLAPGASALGSLLAVATFLTTLTFLVTTPLAWIAERGGFPALSVPGQFVLKDIALLGVSVLTLGEALVAVKLPGRVAVAAPVD